LATFFLIFRKKKEHSPRSGRTSKKKGESKKTTLAKNRLKRNQIVVCSNFLTKNIYIIFFTSPQPKKDRLRPEKMKGVSIHSLYNYTMIKNKNFLLKLNVGCKIISANHKKIK
jgi:hypothetical protein